MSGKLKAALRASWPFLAYLAVRSLILGLTGPIWFSDTNAYVDQYKNGFGAGFLGRQRPWGYPFFLWIMDYRWVLAAAVQRLIAAALWFWLAWAAAGLFRPRALKWIVALGVIVVSLTTFAIMWDPMLLSESLSISLFAGLTAAWIRMQTRSEEHRARGAAVWNGFGICLLAIGFAGLRDSNTPLLLVLAGMMVIDCGLRIADCGLSKIKLKIEDGILLGLALIVVVCALGHHRDVQASRRSWANIANVLSRTICVREVLPERYITEEPHIDWLASHYGMPKAETIARAGKTISQAPPVSPQYEAWLKMSGEHAWAGFLLFHPGWVWQTYAAQTQYSRFPADYLTVEQEKWGRSMIGLSVSLQWIFYRLTGWFFEAHWLNAMLAVAAILAGAGWICAGLFGKNGRRTAGLGTLAWLIGTGVVAAGVAIFGDTIETWRHAIVGLMALYIALPIAAGMIAAPAWEWARSKRETMRGAGQAKAQPRRKRGNPKQKKSGRMG